MLRLTLFAVLIAATPLRLAFAQDATNQPAAATSVQFQGLMGGKALLVIDGQAPRVMSPGNSWRDVKLISVQDDMIELDVQGARRTLRLGESQSNVAETHRRATGRQISMVVGANGHFIADGAINGKYTRFMVDTGASVVSMGLNQAVQLGVNPRNGKRVQVGTANGVADGYFLKLNSVRIGDVEVRDVDAVITRQDMPYVLLGNSFLSQFQMRRDDHIMVLTLP